MDAVSKLKQVMNIDRAKMRVRVSLPHKEAKACHAKLKETFEAVEVEDWEEGNLEIVSGAG